MTTATMTAITTTKKPAKKVFEYPRANKILKQVITSEQLSWLRSIFKANGCEKHATGYKAFKQASVAKTQDWKVYVVLSNKATSDIVVHVVQDGLVTHILASNKALLTR